MKLQVSILALRPRLPPPARAGRARTALATAQRSLSCPAPPGRNAPTALPSGRQVPCRLPATPAAARSRVTAPRRRALSRRAARAPPGRWAPGAGRGPHSAVPLARCHEALELISASAPRRAGAYATRTPLHVGASMCRDPCRDRYTVYAVPRKTNCKRDSVPSGEALRRGRLRHSG
jgi:hypothetical protein